MSAPAPRPPLVSVPAAATPGDRDGYTDPVTWRQEFQAARPDAEFSTDLPFYHGSLLVHGVRERERTVDFGVLMDLMDALRARDEAPE
jgi:hypothetical protein